MAGCEAQSSPSSHLTMNCLLPSPSPSVCRCQCSCRLKSPPTTTSTSTSSRTEPSKPAGSLVSFVRNIQQSWFAVDKNKNSLSSKYSYKKLSQNEAEGAAVSEEELERNEVAEQELSDSGETVMSCETGTQYSAEDALTSTSTSSYSDRIPHYDFSLQLPVSLKEEDCDWDDEDVTCNVCDRSFPTPVHLQAHMIKHRHWLCSHCEELFNSSCELEYHKVRRRQAWPLSTLYSALRTVWDTGVRSTRLRTARTRTVTRSLII